MTEAKQMVTVRAGLADGRGPRRVRADHCDQDQRAARRLGRATPSWRTALASAGLTREYRLRYPFVCAGMAFVAHPALAAAVSNAGGLGVLGATPDPPPSLPVMAAELRSLTDLPWGVDLIHAETGLGPACTDEHIEACIDLQVPPVVFH